MLASPEDNPLDRNRPVPTTEENLKNGKIVVMGPEPGDNDLNKVLIVLPNGKPFNKEGVEAILRVVTKDEARILGLELLRASGPDAGDKPTN